jgi:hypothetical protein
VAAVALPRSPSATPIAPVPAEALEMEVEVALAVVALQRFMASVAAQDGLVLRASRQARKESNSYYLR